MTHVMIDIETMGSQHNAAIISIGLCEFDPAKGIGRTLEVRNTLEAQRAAGRHFDPGTVEWWLRQSPEAQAQLLAKPRFDDAAQMLRAANTFVKEANSSQWNRNVWAKGPNFDLKLIRSLCDDLEIKWSGHYSREYCVRTMLMIAKANGWNDILEMEPGIAHGALSDAIHQAEQVMEVMRRLKK